MQIFDRLRDAMRIFIWRLKLAKPDEIQLYVDSIVMDNDDANNVMGYNPLIKRMYRSKSGTQSLNKVIKAMIADTPLVRSLSNPQYLKIIFNGDNSLKDRFAEIDEKLVRQEMKKRKDIKLYLKG